MLNSDTYHMTSEQQFNSGCIALLICFIIALGVWAIVRDIVKDDTMYEIEDELSELAEDLYENRDQHPERMLTGRWSN